jgi:cation/acetate symporter
VARIATLVLGLVAMILGIAFKGQNVAFMVGLAFAVAASGNFPALVLAVFWRRATTGGMVASILIGTLSALVLVYLSPTIQVELLHHDSAWFPLKNPALISMPLSFAAGVLVSLLSRDAAALEGFERCRRRTILGAESGRVVP